MRRVRERHHEVGADALPAALLRVPVPGRMFRHVPVQNAVRADFWRQEHVKGPERGGHDDEEVTREHASGMVSDERSPRLRVEPRPGS